MPRPSINWTPRSSTLGAYFACDQRAAFDRAEEEGLIERSPRTTSPYADFGTVSHYALQTRLGCVFPGGNHSPDEAQIANAATLFTGGPDELQRHVEATATLAAANMPELIDGTHWLAESEFKFAALSGHIDFLRSDYKEIVDLKTTSRKPDHNRVKPTHLYQLVAYWILVYRKHRTAPDKIHCLYVDSLKASWVLRVQIDCNTVDFLELVDHTEKYLKYLRSKALYSNAVPRLGNSCASDFCPHVGRCRDKYVPPAGDIKEASAYKPPPMVSI